MIVETPLGKTEVRFADFAHVEPKVVRLREAFRAKKATKEDVDKWCAKLFGMTRFNKDFDEVTKGKEASEALRTWDAWIEAQPLIHRKLYYNDHVVAACVMGADE